MYRCLVIPKEIGRTMRICEGGRELVVFDFSERNLKDFALLLNFFVADGIIK